MPGLFDSLLVRENKLCWLLTIIKDLEGGIESLNNSTDNNRIQGETDMMERDATHRDLHRLKEFH